MKSLQVGLGERSYSIIIRNGLLADIGVELKKQGFAKRYFVISDSTVADLYGQQLLNSLQQAGYEAEILIFPAGEQSKVLDTIGELASRLARLGMDRHDGLLALGGGVTGDITGFFGLFIYERCTICSDPHQPLSAGR